MIGRLAVILAHGVLLCAPWAGSLEAQDAMVGPTEAVHTVRDALARVPAAARIVVLPGTYREPRIVVDHPVEIIGVGWPVLDAGGGHEIMTITANGVRVHGLVFRNVGVSYTEDRAGVRVTDARDCTIDGNRFAYAFFAIYLARARHCLVSHNDILSRTVSQTAAGNGIHLWHSDSITIVGNHIVGQRDGIYFEFVHDSDIRDNLSEANARYGLHFMFSDGCRYDHNTFRDNGAGVAVMYTKHVTMTRNQFERSRGSGAYGLLLKDITDSRIDSNQFRDNTVGLYADGATRVAIGRNTFMGNGWALRVMASAQDNTFADNTFIRNAFDLATNSSQSANTFDRNFWDDYRGYDLDGDGFGDVPFHPERLVAEMVESYPATVLLLDSPVLGALDAAERALPVLTPAAQVDRHPRMRALVP